MAQQKFIMLVLVLLIVGQVYCDLPAGFKRCDHTKTVVENFLVSGSTDLPYKIRLGQYINFKLDFVTDADFGEIETNIKSENFRYLWQGYQCGERKRTGKAGELQSLDQSFKFHDKPYSFTQNDTMQFYLDDADTSKRIICIEFPVEIVLD